MTRDLDAGQIEWLDPWRPVSPSEARTLEAELEREMSRQHPLFGIKVEAIGRRDDKDDVLFRLEGAPPRVAVVHMTWSGTAGKDPRWPHAVIFGSLADWVEKEMRLDHEGDEAAV